MPCELKKEDLSFPGTTLFSKYGSPCLKKPTAVYLPPKHLDTNNTLNVVLWLHGLYVTGHKQLFHGDKARVRATVLKDVVLIAPYLGHGDFDDKGNAVGDYSTADLGTEKWGENYLNEVLDAVAPHQKWSSKFIIENLVIACHSGGGTGMRNLVGTLGEHEPKLGECWGFDVVPSPAGKPSGFSTVAVYI